MNPRSFVCAILLASNAPAFAQAFVHGRKPADEKKVLRNTDLDLDLDLDLEEDDIMLSHLEREGMLARYRARLKDGIGYRCKIASAGGLTRIMGFGADRATIAECVKRMGSGKGPEPGKSPLQVEPDRRHGALASPCVPRPCNGDGRGGIRYAAQDCPGGQSRTGVV